MMKRKPSDLPKMSKPKSVKKTIVINCFTGEEREVDRRKIKIVDGMEIGNTRVELDNGVKLAVAGEGKYHTLGNPKERWAEVAEVLVLPDGEYGDGELLGWTPLFSSSCKTLSTKKAVPKSGERKKGETSKATTKKETSAHSRAFRFAKQCPNIRKPQQKRRYFPDSSAYIRLSRQAAAATQKAKDPLKALTV